MSSKKYDVETFRDAIISIVQSNLAAKITEINTEKNDDYVLTDIATSSYYNDITDQVLNVSPFIYYGLSNVIVKTNGAQTSLVVTMFISIVFDNQNQNGVESKALRYIRSLREIILANYKKIPSASPLLIDEFLPTNFQLNKGADFKIGGVHVTATIMG